LQTPKTPSPIQCGEISSKYVQNSKSLFMELKGVIRRMFCQSFLTTQLFEIVTFYAKTILANTAPPSKKGGNNTRCISCKRTALYINLIQAPHWKKQTCLNELLELREAHDVLPNWMNFFPFVFYMVEGSLGT
jgi:hypothetical protein